MNDNEQTVRGAFEAFASGDMATVQSIFADDIVVHVPPGLPISGDHHGWDGFVHGMLTRLVAALDGPPQVEVHDFTASDEHVVGLYTIHVERNHDAYEWRAHEHLLRRRREDHRAVVEPVRPADRAAGLGC